MIGFWYYLDCYEYNSVKFIETVDNMAEYISYYGITPELLKRGRPLSEKQIAFIAKHFEGDEYLDTLRENIKETSRMIGEKIEELKRNSKLRNQDIELFENSNVSVDLDYMDTTDNDKKIIKLLIESENLYRVACNLEKGKKKTFCKRKEILREAIILAVKSGKYNDSLYGEAMLFKLEIFEQPVIVRYHFTRKEYKRIPDYIKEEYEDDKNYNDVKTKINYMTIGQMVRNIKHWNNKYNS